MKLYLLTQTVHDGYDTYDSCIVCAENEEEAKKIRPGIDTGYIGDWARPEDITAKEITTETKGLILSSFNAG